MVGGLEGWTVHDFLFGNFCALPGEVRLSEENDPLATVPAFGIDGRAFPIASGFGVIGKIATADARFLDIKEPMGHTVRLRKIDLERGLGGRENAEALIADAKAHEDAVTIRFDSTGVSYHNTTQFLRFERAMGTGLTPPFNPTDTQRRTAARDDARKYQRLINREFPGRR